VSGAALSVRGPLLVDTALDHGNIAEHLDILRSKLTAVELVLAAFEILEVARLRDGLAGIVLLYPVIGKDLTELVDIERHHGAHPVAFDLFDRLGNALVVRGRPGWLSEHRIHGYAADQNQNSLRECFHRLSPVRRGNS